MILLEELLSVNGLTKHRLSVALHTGKGAMIYLTLESNQFPAILSGPVG